MHAIILAASNSNPPGESGADAPPACLKEVDGRSLLAQLLDQLFQLGVRAADLVVGYEARLIIDHVGTLSSRPDVAFHFNPRFELGSVLSLRAAEETLKAGDDVLVIDANVLCHPAVLQKLVESPVENCFLLDREAESNSSSFKIALLENRMVDYCRQIPEGLEHDAVAESPGLYKFGPRAAECIAEECERLETEGLSDGPHEEVIRQVMLSCPLAFAYEDVSGLPWARFQVQYAE